MKQKTSLGTLSGILVAVLAGACSSGANDSASGGFGSSAAVDGGDVASAGASGGGAEGSTGGTVGIGGLGLGSAPVSGTGGAGQGSASSAGGAAGAVGHVGPVTAVVSVGTSDAVCSTQSVNAAAGILDVFIMLDRSKSMTEASAGGSKWEVITAAIQSFLKAPESATMNAGIGFFGIAAATQGGGGNNSSCAAADYAAPVVPIATLGGAAANATKIAAAITAQSPGSNTPTEPALQGAIDYASSWAKQHPTHKVIVVFATDGLPNGCNSTVAGAAKVAASGVALKPAIQTYVIGVFGDQDCPGGVTQGQTCPVVSNTNQIAKGGGTGTAFIVNASASTGEQFLSALNAIRTANEVGCTFAVPAPAKGKAIDFSVATVRYTPSKGAAVALPWKASAAACGTTTGWYYNNDKAPNQVLLCGASCSAVTADAGAKVDVVLACEPPGTTQGTGGATGAGGAGTSGSGGASSGSGGATGAGGATGNGGAGECLLAGQSCQSAAECCGGWCTSGVCQSNVR